MRVRGMRWGIVGLLGSGLALSSGCGGSSLTGSVGGLQFPSIEDGFYTQFTSDDVDYYAVVLTDFDDACNAFNAAELSLGSSYSVFQLWLTAPDVQDYPVYAVSHLDEAAGDHAVTFDTVVLNNKEVVNTDGVAGVVQVTDYEYEQKFLSGTLDVIFSGNGNRLQGGFSVPYCEVNWKDVSEELLKNAAK